VSNPAATHCCSELRAGIKQKTEAAKSTAKIGKSRKKRRVMYAWYGSFRVSIKKR
jgi:hypothetical protein